MHTYMHIIMDRSEIQSQYSIMAASEGDHLNGLTLMINCKEFEQGIDIIYILCLAIYRQVGVAVQIYISGMCCQ